MSAKKRYRSLWVFLHWLMALLVFVTFGIGLASLGKASPNDGKIIPVAIHMILGIAILVIVIFRYILRVLVYNPPRNAKTRSIGIRKLAFLDQLSLYVHPLLYLFSALMAVLGILIAVPADLFTVVFARSGGQLPQDFYIFPTRTWHGTFSLVLMMLIAQHVLVAIFHQFLKGENFIGRMWFPRK